MQTTIDFLNELKSKYNLRSNYALARKLGQTDTAIARWMKGKNTFSDDNAMQVAELLDLDPAYVVACIHAERSKHEAERTLWERIAKMAAEHKALAASIFGGVCLALIMSGGGMGAEGLPLLGFAAFTQFDPSIHYAQFATWAALLNWAIFAALIAVSIAAYPRNNPPKKTRQEAHNHGEQ